MSMQIAAITLALPLGRETANCYLLQTGDGFVLIDTGPSRGRAALEEALAAAGCRPGDLKLVILTHGDIEPLSPEYHGNDGFMSAYGGQKLVHSGGTRPFER